MTRVWLIAVALTVAVAACTSEDATVVFVTVDVRPSVTEADTMNVVITNDGMEKTERFDIDGESFPLTFTVSAKGRVGDLSIDIATTAGTNSVLVAAGSGTTTIEAQSRVNAAVMLDPADFVVNTAVAGSQRLTFTNDENDGQIHAASDGAFAITFEDDCGMLNRCDIFSRLFDANGQPQVNQTSQNDDAFIANLAGDQFRIAPSVAVGETSIFLAWEGDGGIKGVVLSRDGEHQRGTEIDVSGAANSGKFPFTSHVTALAGGGFVAVWSQAGEAPNNGNVIRARFFDDAGTPSNNPFTGNNADFPVSTSQNVWAISPKVVSTGSGRGFVAVWKADDDVFARFFNSNGSAITASETNLTTNNSGADVLSPHVVMSGAHAVIAWGVKDTTVPELANGVLRVARFSTPAAARVSPVLTLETKVPGFDDNRASAPALASMDGERVMAVWHSCERTDSEGCAVWYQVLRPSGLPLGDPILANTTTAGDQVAPSAVALPSAIAVAWTDGSAAPPDQSGLAVRARLLYPELDPNDGRRGARCGGPADAGCGAGLVCMPGVGGNTPYCHDVCDPASSEPQCSGGGVCSTLGESSGCLF